MITVDYGISIGKLVKQVVRVILRKAASPPHTDGSVIFARWRQYRNSDKNGCRGNAPWLQVIGNISVFC